MKEGKGTGSGRERNKVETRDRMGKEGRKNGKMGRRRICPGGQRKDREVAKTDLIQE